MSKIGRYIAEKPLREERSKNDYARLSIDLGDAAMVGTNIELAVTGDKLAKIKYDGSATGTYFTFDHRHAAKIYAKEFKSSVRRFEKIYLTNPAAQAGKVLVLQINELDVSEIEPDTVDEEGHLSAIETAVEAIQVDAAALETLVTAGNVDLAAIKTALDGIDLKIQTVSSHLNSIKTYTAAIEVATEGMEADVTQVTHTDNTEFANGISGLFAAGFVHAAAGGIDVGDGDAGAARISANRNLFVSIRDGATNERGVNVNASNELLVKETDLKVDTAAMVTDLAAIEALDIDIEGNTTGIWDDTTAIAAFMNVDGGGDLQKVKEELEAANVDLAAIETLLTRSRAAYENQVATTAGAAAFEGASKVLNDVVIKNNHATTTSAIGDSAAQRFQLAPGDAVSFKEIDLSTLYHIRITAADGTLVVIGSEK